MDWSQILASFFAAAASAAVVHFLRNEAGQVVAEDEKGEVVLSLPKMYLYIGWFVLVVLLPFIGIAIYVNEMELYIMAAVFVFFLGGLGVCIFPYYNNRLTFDDNGFTWQNWNKKSIRMTWREI